MLGSGQMGEEQVPVALLDTTSQKIARVMQSTLGTESATASRSYDDPVYAFRGGMSDEMRARIFRENALTFYRL